MANFRYKTPEESRKSKLIRFLEKAFPFSFSGYEILMFSILIIFSGFLLLLAIGILSLKPSFFEIFTPVMLCLFAIVWTLEKLLDANRINAITLICATSASLLFIFENIAASRLITIFYVVYALISNISCIVVYSSRRKS